MNNTLIVILICFSIVEGLLALWLLWKLCKKTEAIHVVSKKRVKKLRNILHYAFLFRKLGEEKDFKKAYDNLEKLKKERNKIEKKILSMFPAEDRAKSEEGNQDEQNDCLEKLDELIKEATNYKNLLGDPMSVININDLSNSELYHVMSDLVKLESYAEQNGRGSDNQKRGDQQSPKGDKGNPKVNKASVPNLKKLTDSSSKQTKNVIEFESDIVKKRVQPVLDAAWKFDQFKSYEPYFVNIAKAANDSLYDIAEKDDNTYSIQILLMYLSQLYAISKVLGEICNNQKKDKESGDNKIAVCKANVQPFCEKMATIDDIISVKEKGEPFRQCGGDNDAKLQKFLKKHKPLDFNLLGRDCSDL